MKFYIGTPFTDHNLIDENSISQGEAYFIKREIKNNIFGDVYERILNDQVDLVIYTKVLWNNNELLLFHNTYYHRIDYFVEKRN